MKTAIWLAEKGYVPEFLLRQGIRRLLTQRLEELHAKYDPKHEQEVTAWIEHMRASPIALVPEKANEQHYEVPPEFFKMVLGPNLKYSSGYYPQDAKSLKDGEDAMLQITCERA
jgi:cyclopropane-fatty-acyl-phospholipid synthase